jgi:hypothetical protein
MKDLNMQKGIEQIKKVSLTTGEKNKMLHNIYMYADFHRPISSPFSLLSFMHLSKKFACVLASIIIAVLVGGSITYASENSLPGDLFYPIKTKIVEPIETVLAATPKAKAEVETELADKRLKEAETLDRVGKLTPEIKKELSDKFDSHVSNFYKIKKNIEEENKNTEEENNKMQENFDDKINPHTEILNKFNKNPKDIEETDVHQENIDVKKIDSKNTNSEDSFRKTPFQSNF